MQQARTLLERITLVEPQRRPVMYDRCNLGSNWTAAVSDYPPQRRPVMYDRCNPLEVIESPNSQ